MRTIRDMKANQSNSSISVRVVLDKSPLVKHLTNLSKESYVVDSKDGNQFVIRSSDGSVDTIPRYKIMKSAKNVPLATTIKNGKRGIIKDIKSYNKKKDTYSVTYETKGGFVENSIVKDTIQPYYQTSKFCNV